MLRQRRGALRLERRGRSNPGRCATRDGMLVGWGMGTATFPALMFQAEARAVIRRDGTGVMRDRRA